jgi:sugar phosphate isomerase/epimerase
MKKYLLFSLFLFPCLLFAQNWVHYSSTNGDIPAPDDISGQICLATDLNKDGIDDIVLGREYSSSLIWYEYTGTRTIKHDIASKYEMIRSNGSSFDLDNDGDLDLIFGSFDWGHHNHAEYYCWFENPFPNTNDKWTKHQFSQEESDRPRYQVIADFKQIGKPQFVFYSSSDNSLKISDIPTNPKVYKWANKIIFTKEGEGKDSFFPRNLTATDIDGDGWLDLVAGNYWFKYDVKNDIFKPINFANEKGKVVCGKFHPGKTKQIVMVNSSEKGRLMLYDCIGNPENPADWKGRDIGERELNNAYSLEIADINSDGFLDIFCAEEAKYQVYKEIEGIEEKENPKAEAIIFYGDGQNNFTKKIFRTGIDFNEPKLSDLDGDGDIDIATVTTNLEKANIEVWMQDDIGSRIPEIGAWVQNQNRFGLQLYSLRDYFKKDVPSTFDYVKSLGIKEVEAAGLYNLSAETVKNHLDTRSLEAKGGLFDFDMLRDSLDKVIKICRTLKTDMIGCAWIPHNAQFNKGDADNAIKVFNEVGKKVAAAGFKFVYHPHGYEFEPIEGKTTLYDYLMENTHPLYVFYEIDVFWATHGGEDPVLLMNRYKGRILSLHLKDMAWGQKTGDYTGQAPLTSDVAIGTGQIDFREILKTAYKTNVRYLFVEDENAEVKAHLPVSLEYLKGLK